MGSHLSRCTLWASSNQRNRWRLSDQSRSWKRLDRFVTPDASGFGPNTPAYGNDLRACDLPPLVLPPTSGERVQRNSLPDSEIVNRSFYQIRRRDLQRRRRTAVFDVTIQPMLAVRPRSPGRREAERAPASPARDAPLRAPPASRLPRAENRSRGSGSRN